MSHKTILTIAAHPDDEILGCGGTMARLAEEGCEVHILIMAEGLTSRQDSRNRDIKLGELNQLKIAAESAASHIGAKTIELLDYPDNRMDSVDLLDVIKSIEKKIDKLNPEIIFTHFPGDLNVDHRIIAEAVITAIRPIPNQTVRQLYFFEVPSSTDYQIYSSLKSFEPNVFFCLSENHLKKKLQALGDYHSEMRPHPHSRSIENLSALASVRGASIGSNYAESFVLGRIIS